MGCYRAKRTVKPDGVPCVATTRSTRPSPLTSPVRSPSWWLWRMDDNGGKFRVASFQTRGEAEQQLQTMEARGHKQSYWVNCEVGASPEP